MNIVVFIDPTQVVDDYWESVVTNMSADSKAGIEIALQLRDKNGGGEVTAVAIGTEDADTALREALAMGVDHAALMRDENPSTESAEKIIKAIQNVGGEIIITGRQDEEMITVASRLNLPTKLGIEVKSYQEFEQIPCLFFVNASMAEPRHMSVGGVYSAYKKQIIYIPPVDTVVSK